MLIKYINGKTKEFCLPVCLLANKKIPIAALLALLLLFSQTIQFSRLCLPDVALCFGLHSTTVANFNASNIVVSINQISKFAIVVEGGRLWKQLSSWNYLLASKTALVVGMIG